MMNKMNQSKINNKNPMTPSPGSFSINSNTVEYVTGGIVWPETLVCEKSKDW